MNRLERLLAELFQQKIAEIGVFPTPPSPNVLRKVRRRQAVALTTAIVFLGAVTVGSVAGAQALLRGRQRPAEQITPSPHRGGSVVLAAEDWPECLNPINGCASSTGAWWFALEHVIPRAMQLDAHGNFVASALLEGAPALANGGLTTDPFTVTYHLNPKATWADGTPITSADFQFTWRAVLNTTGAYTTVSYDTILSIDVSDPKTVVIGFKDIVTDWQDLFGGVAGGILERAAFPKFADDPKPNLKNEMQDSIPFSGGPWILKSFGLAHAVLARNERYYGKIPLLDQITFVPMNAIDPSSRIRALLNGQVAAVHIFPFEAEVLGQLSGQPNVKVTSGDEFFLEVLWFNHESPPIDDAQVRNALMYAIDRQAVVDRFAKPNNPQARVANCGLLALPTVGPWCQTQPFEGFTYDPVKAKSILESDGYDCSSVPCTKHGRRLMVEYTAVSTNSVRSSIRALLQEKSLAAGFDLRIKNYESGILFQDVASHGAFTMAEAASEITSDPSISFTLACESTPTKANGFKGSNWARWCNRRATDLMHEADRELDPDRRLQLMNQVYALEAQDFVSLPLYVPPVVAAWRTDKIAGPIGDFNGSPYGLFFNVNEWYTVRGT